MSLIVVSNRVSSLSGNSVAAGGLAAALSQGIKARKATWVGWSGKTVDDVPRAPQIAEFEDSRQVTVDYERGDFDGFYNGMANGTLWPIMHNRVDLMVYDRAFLKSYERVNRQLAAVVAKLAGPGDTIWVHDYQLMMMGPMLRQAGVTCPIGFFLHTPFPASFSLECMPEHDHLFGHLLGYDLIGFQTGGDMRSFLRYALRSLDAREIGPNLLRSMNGLTRLGIYPVGIGINEYAAMAAAAEGEPQVVRLKQTMGSDPIVIGVDRLDYSKGLPQRFRAFERLLANHPERREHLCLLQIAPPSRSDVIAYQALGEELAALTGRINGQFGNPVWQPIRYTNETYSPAVLAGFYRTSRACCVTPLRDGMNLVAKEYVASQHEDDPGVLVLSQFAGAAQELDTALIVNPYDVEQVANALERALSMDKDERLERWRTMMKVLRVNDVTAWFDGFVTDLEKTRPAEPDRSPLASTVK